MKPNFRQLFCSILRYLSIATIFYESFERYGFAATEPELLRVGVPSAPDTSWRPFENFLNAEINARGGEFKITIEEHSMTELMEGMRKGQLDAAILPPLRYVLLDTEIPLIPLTRLLRNKAIQGAIDHPQISAEPREGEEYYTSLIVMRRNSGAWPPDPKATNIVMAAVSATSTSGFLYPAFWLKEQTEHMKELKSLSPHFRIFIVDPFGKNPRRLFDIDELLRNPALLEGGGIPEVEKVQQLLDGFLKGTQTNFSFIGIGSDRYEKLLNPDKKRDLYELGKSPPIYFDVFALNAGSRPTNIAASSILKAALLSTRSFKHNERTNIFQIQFHQNSQTWLSAPDIHSFEAVADSDYDDIRRKWVLLSGGAVIRLGMSSAVHKDARAGMEYFRNLRRMLMKATNGFAPVFLQVEFRPEETLEDLRRKLEHGDLDVIESSATEAGSLLFDRQAITIGIAQFRDKTLSSRRTDMVNALEHRFVILSASEASDRFEMLNQKSQIAHADARTSSGYRFPIYSLEASMKVKIDRKRLLEVNDYLGVYKALKDYISDPIRTNAARFGIMAEYEWFRLKEEFALDGIHRMEMLDGDRIPNTMLLASREFAPVNADLDDVRSKIGFSFDSILEDKRADPKVNGPRIAALRALRAALSNAAPAIDPNGESSFGFICYTNVPPAIVEHVVSVHKKFTSNLLAFTLVSLLPIVGGAVFIVLLRFRNK